MANSRATTHLPVQETDKSDETDSRHHFTCGLRPDHQRKIPHWRGFGGQLPVWLLHPRRRIHGHYSVQRLLHGPQHQQRHNEQPSRSTCPQTWSFSTHHKQPLDAPAQCPVKIHQSRPLWHSVPKHLGWRHMVPGGSEQPPEQLLHGNLEHGKVSTHHGNLDFNDTTIPAHTDV